MQSNGYAKGMNFFVYLVLAVVAFAFLSNHHTAFGVPGVYIMQGALIVIVLLYYILTVSEKVSAFAHAWISASLLVGIAWLMGIIFERIDIYMVMTGIPLITVALYLDYRVYASMNIAFLLQLMAATLLPIDLFGDRPQGLLLLSYYLVAIIMGSVLLFFMRILAFRDRSNKEQERSLDDMQKVIFAKCLEARAATDSKTEFLSSMSHEIRTPLNAILGMNEMILRESKNEDISNYSENINRSGNMLLAIINDILDFSKIESGKLQLESGEYHFFTVAGDVIQMVRPRIQEKGIKLVVDVAPGIPGVLYSDEVRVKQIITNIMTNAAKYTETGTITFLAEITDEVPGKDVVISPDSCVVHVMIKDTGQGMTKENLEHIFTSFERFNLKKNRQIEGTGLGMAITKRLVDGMGGNIIVESEYGVGSTFHVYLPQRIISAVPSGVFDLEHYGAEHTASKEKISLSFSGAKILVVDDSRVNQKVVQGLLKYYNMKVDAASSGRECLEKVQAGNYHLILLDHMMPEMDGIETLKALKEQKLVDKTKVIALTANAVANGKEVYQKYGFDDYITKPISGKRLESVLLKWLPDEIVEKGK